MSIFFVIPAVLCFPVLCLTPGAPLREALEARGFCLTAPYEEDLARERRAIATTSSLADPTATADKRASSSSAGADMTVTAMADLLREKLSLSVDLNITQVADAAAEKLNLKLPVNIALKDKLDAAVKSVQAGAV